MSDQKIQMQINEVQNFFQSKNLKPSYRCAGNSGTHYGNICIWQMLDRQLLVKSQQIHKLLDPQAQDHRLAIDKQRKKLRNY